jgi:hypothetical protein
MDQRGRASDSARYSSVVPERGQPMMNTGDVINQNSLDRSADTSRVPDGADDALAFQRSEPFFVIGAHRSGTTLLRYMLSSHPRLYLPPESEFIPAFFGRSPTRPLNRSESRRILRKIFRLRFVREWQGAPPDIDDLVPEGETFTPARLVGALYTAYANQHGAARWGDKTPTYTSHIELLHRIFPRARFIHLIRDGRDVALSVLDTWGRRAHVDLVFAARSWVRRVAEACCSGGRFDPESYLELRYEDLVVEPEKELRRVCRFLDEDFHPKMLQFHLTAEEWIQEGGFHDAVRNPLTTERIDRWRKEMSASDLRVFEAVAGPTLTGLGYELVSERPPTATDRLRIAILSAKYSIYRFVRRFAELLGLRMPN